MALIRPGVALFAAAVMLSGCETSNLIPERFRSQQAGQASETSANAGSTESANRSSDEDATDSETQAEQALLTGASAEQVAKKPPSQSIGRADLLGGWKVTSGNDNCQLFMSLTGRSARPID